MTTTATHYAKWCESDGIYREPMRLGEGEVPADLLARLGVERSEARYSEEVRPHPLQEAV